MIVLEQNISSVLFENIKNKNWKHKNRKKTGKQDPGTNLIILYRAIY